MTDRILHTPEFHTDGGREAGTVFERARVCDGLVDTEAYLLLAVRIVLEGPFRKCDLLRSDDLASRKIKFDVVDFHLLP